MLVCGARPLYFLDFFGAGRLRLEVAEQVIAGLVKSCKENGCSLVGGETAELPGLYEDGEYDLAGVVVGVVEKRKIIDGRKIRRGDVLIGLPSTGLTPTAIPSPVWFCWSTSKRIDTLTSSAVPSARSF
ncbi:MAG: AIR synthase related protein [Bacteroidota bacterium]